jgi:hypothetical protein
MPDLAIDIKLDDHIVKQLTPPTCALLELPEPGTLNLCSPFGGARFQAIVDVTKGIPDDCSLTFSLLAQLPPFMVSLGCFVKILKVAKPLLDFIEAVKTLDVGKIVQAAPALVEALGEVVACLTSLIAGVPMFIKDLLILVAKLLKCISKMILDLAKLIGGLEISIKTAEAAGNKELLDQLSCAKDNASAQAKAAAGSVDIIAVIMAMAEPLMALANIPPPTIPAIASAEDIFTMEQTAHTMLSIASSLEQIAQSLPSC